MPGPVARPDLDRVLGGLRDFQRATVDYVFERMYSEADPVRRFLVADEVGLGKTLVARGVVAKVVDKLWDSDVKRIDVVYICSNSSIARQNVSRLNVTDSDDIALPTRITLLPATIKDLERNRLNFVSFTPGTSFSLRSSLGTAEERALLYWLLPDDWKQNRYAAVTLLAGSAGRSGFDGRVEQFDHDVINVSLKEGFQKELARELKEGERSLRERFMALADGVGRRTVLSPDERSERNCIVGELRSALAVSCVEALEPDLVILDEFQRFKHLLDGEDSAGLLARRLFDYGHARMLLLSATPYKMYTLDDEAGGEDHFADFVQTVGFLQNDPARTNRFKIALGEYRRELMRYTAEDGHALSAVRNEIQTELRRVIVRTERLAVTPDRNGMLAEVPPRAPNLKPTDIEHYLALQRVSRTANCGDAIEYWKSAPYLLNFMEDYELKREFREALAHPDTSEIYNALASGPSTLLSWGDVQRYAKVDPANARLRNLIADLDENGAWDVPWIPPACAYYKPEGPFSGNAERLTKRLIFSSWQVVPKAVAALLSYEAERRFAGVPDAGQDGANEKGGRERTRPLLRFALKDGRPQNMTALGLIYPSFYLAATFDPLELAGALRQGDAPPALAEVIAVVKGRLAESLERLPQGAGEAEDDRWYWAALILLDSVSNVAANQRWFGQGQLRTTWRPPVRTQADEDGHEADDREASDAWAMHVNEARALLKENNLGRQPADLADVLAWVAVAGPGVVVLRSLARVTGNLQRASSVALRNAAGPVADGFLTLFNLPEVREAIRREGGEEPYWRRVLEFAAKGGIQAVVDEYAHVLIDAQGKRGRSLEDIAAALAHEMAGALRTRTANLGMDVIQTDAATRSVSMHSERGAFRSRFAVRFGAKATDEGAAGERDDVVRRAFNSPFWPFVLCSTSVGQEGLDFHHYCHAVVHWNIPSNPVDMEQREGRVHRYKNHAVRRNIARRHGRALLNTGHPDPWQRMFREAEAARDGDTSDISPYWVFTTPGGATIERHVPVLPLSADAAKAQRLRRSLAVYRLAFGQSRQEDLVAYLSETLTDDQVAKVSEELRIDLSPPRRHASAGMAAGLADEPSPERGLPLKDLFSSSGAGAGDLDALTALLDAFSALHRNGRTSLTAVAARELLDAFGAARRTPKTAAS